MAKDVTQAQTTTTSSSADRTTQGKPQETKSAHLRRLLGRRTGATLPALQSATGWQAHSVRAALSGFRKAGYTINRTDSVKPGGDATYRLTGKPDGSA